MPHSETTETSTTATEKCDRCKVNTQVPLTKDWPALKKDLQAALRKTIAEKDLFKFHAGERAVAHRLACHLHEMMSLDGWSVDCEYNRFQDDKKTVPISELHKVLLSYKDAPPGAINSSNVDNAVEQAIRDLDGDIQSSAMRRVIPDIVVHRRGCSCYNLLVMEMKVNKTTDACILLDWAKLAKFTATRGTTGYPVYNFGIFLDLTNTKSIKAWRFEDSKPSETEPF